MKIQIHIGDITEFAPIVNWKTNIHFDNIETEKQAMYNVLLDNDENCIIDNVDMFLLYSLNNGILAHNVKDNPKISKDSKFHNIPKFNPEIYRIYQIDENDNKTNIQDVDGTIKDSYINSLMMCVMDDFYIALNYLEPK